MTRSLLRIFALAHNSLLEALRQKALNLLVLFSLICIGSANLFQGFNFEDQIKFLKDFSFGAMSVFGLLIAVLGASTMIQREIENRTIYTVLSKPVRRAEFLWGKFLGLAALVLLALFLMTAVFALVLFLKEPALSAQLHSEYGPTEQEALQSDLHKLHASIYDPSIIQAWLLLIMKLLLTAGIGTLVATVATSSLFVVASTLMIYLIGHLQSTARTVWLHGETAPLWWQRALTDGLAIVLPDFSAFGIMDDLLAGNVIPWGHSLGLLSYGVLYLVVILLVSQLVFEEREL